jgi:methionyl-tRNA formyltransferase
MIRPMRLLYLGSGEFGLPTLRALAAAHTIAGVVTQPDRPAGRGRELTPTPIGAWAAAHLPDVQLFKPENVNEPAVVERLGAIATDAWVVIAFGQKLGRPLLADRFAINLHASLLPRWRGAAPINAAIMAGDAVTGNTVITLADRMDAGEILGQTERPIEPSCTAGALHDLLAADGPALVTRVLDDFAAGGLVRRPQDESLKTRAPKLSKADAWVDFRQTAAQCRNRVHGLTPWPGVGATLAGGSQRTDLKLTRVAAVERAEGVPPEGGKPGTLVDVRGGLVACGGGTLLRVELVKPAGKREMEWGEFVAGRRIDQGSRLASGEEHTRA